MHKGVLERINTFFCSRLHSRNHGASSCSTALGQKVAAARVWLDSRREHSHWKLAANQNSGQSSLFSEPFLFSLRPLSPSFHFKIPQAAATSHIFGLFLAVCLMWKASQTATFFHLRHWNKTRKRCESHLLLILMLETFVPLLFTAAANVSPGHRGPGRRSSAPSRQSAGGGAGDSVCLLQRLQESENVKILLDVGNHLIFSWSFFRENRIWLTESLFSLFHKFSSEIFFTFFSNLWKNHSKMHQKLVIHSDPYPNCVLILGLQKKVHAESFLL